MSTGLLIASVLFAVALAQAMVIGRWRDAIARKEERKRLPDDALPAIAAIIPVRNEERGIARVLQDMHAQDYPKERIEVLLVDDGSDDRTVEIAQGMRKSWPQLQVVRSESEGKKAAIAMGISASRAEIIVLTDADARFGAQRIRCIAERMASSGAELLVLPVWTNGQASLGGLQEVEQAALLGVALGTAMNGSPFLAYGANLAFSRAAFVHVGGYQGDRFASGDDVFLLRRMRANGKPVRALADPEALVEVEAAGTWRGFFAQRLRWAGKMRGAIGSFSVFGAVGLLWPWALALVTARFSILGALGQHGFYQFILLLAAWLLWVVPIIGLVQDLKRAFSKPSGTAPTLLALLAFTVYAPLIALLSLVVRPKWKGRRLGSS
ncbi:MAG: glycosyltransferase [Flavobacteriales bacterium]|nr:glycosyltransferase [Flavobacteriales bacterium]